MILLMMFEMVVFFSLLTHCLPTVARWTVSRRKTVIAFKLVLQLRILIKQVQIRAERSPTFTDTRNDDPTFQLLLFIAKRPVVVPERSAWPPRPVVAITRVARQCLRPSHRVNCARVDHSVGNRGTLEYDRL